MVQVPQIAKKIACFTIAHHLSPLNLYEAGIKGRTCVLQ